ncbi:MAG: extracellular solute-binding protein [bacterium]
MGRAKSPSPPEPITLEYWRLWDDSDALDSYINDYTRSHKNVTIEVKKFSLTQGKTVYDYQNEIINLIADGKGPDMFMINNTWLPRFVNKITPMPESSMSLKDFNNTFPAAVQEDFVTNDRIYAVPYAIDNLMLFYNTDIFAKNKIKSPPRTLQELAALAPRLTVRSGTQIQTAGITLGGNQEGVARVADILAALMMQYGADLTLADRQTPAFDLPVPNTNPPIFGAEEALAYYTQFANPSSPYYSFTDAKDSTGNRLFPVDIQAFTEGKAAMMIGYAHQVKNIRQFNPTLKFNTAPLPQNQLQDPATVIGYWGETVSKNAQYPAVAWDFIKYMTGKSQQKSYAKKTSQIPARKDLTASYTSQQYYGAVAKQVDYAKSWYHSNTVEVEAVFSRMVDNVVKYNFTPKIAIETATRELNQLE